MGPGELEKKDFFISYMKADEAWAVWIAYQLEDTGYTTVVQAWDFRPGANFVLEMQQAAQTADRTIAVLSPDYIESRFAAPEWASAFGSDPLGLERKLVPVLVKPCRPPGLFASIVYIDLVGKSETDAQKSLIAGLKRERARPSKAPTYPGTPEHESPRYPGEEVALPTRNNIDVLRRVEELGWGVRPDRDLGYWTSDTSLGIVLVPEVLDTSFIDILELGDRELHKTVQRLALFGDGAIFNAAKATSVTEQEHHITLQQSDGRVVAALDIHIDGSLVYRTNVERPDQSSWVNLAAVHVIDEQRVKEAITGLLGFASQFYKERPKPTGRLYLGLSLSDIDRKHFGRLPDAPLREFTIGDPRLPDPLHVPETPIEISLEALMRPENTAAVVIAHIARKFRLAGAYYPDSQR